MTSAPKSKAGNASDKSIAQTAETILDPEAFLTNSRDQVETFLNANETIMKSMTALNAEMMAFGSRRISENLDRGETLADCEGAEDALRVHSQFFQTATQQYLEQTGTMLAIISRIVPAAFAQSDTRPRLSP